MARIRPGRLPGLLAEGSPSRLAAPRLRALGRSRTASADDPRQLARSRPYCRWPAGACLTEASGSTRQPVLANGGFRGVVRLPRRQELISIGRPEAAWTSAPAVKAIARLDAGK